MITNTVTTARQICSSTLMDIITPTTITIPSYSSSNYNNNSSNHKTHFTITTITIAAAKINSIYSNTKFNLWLPTPQHQQQIMLANILTSIKIRRYISMILLLIVL